MKELNQTKWMHAPNKTQGRKVKTLQNLKVATVIEIHRNSNKTAQRENEL
jgi:hypothetical protein